MCPKVNDGSAFPHDDEEHRGHCLILVSRTKSHMTIRTVQVTIGVVTLTKESAPPMRAPSQSVKTVANRFPFLMAFVLGSKGFGVPKMPFKFLYVSCIQGVSGVELLSDEGKTRKRPGSERREHIGNIQAHLPTHLNAHA